MQRISNLDSSLASEETTQLLDGVKRKMGMVPNLVSTMAHSLPITKAYLEFSNQLTKGKLSAAVREQIALVVGQANQCDYCLAAHSMLAANFGVSDAEISAARRGMSTDEKTSAALRFAKSVVDTRGHIADSDVESLRDAGFDEEEIIEIIGNISLNMFTNYFNHIATTEIDFPVAAAI